MSLSLTEKQAPEIDMPDPNTGSELPKMSYEASALLAQHSLLADGVDPDAGCLLAYYPRAARNPFQDMLYSDARSAKVAVFPVHDAFEVVGPALGMKTIAHYHWVHRVFGQCRTSRDAAKAADKFLRHVDTQRAAGVSVVWTIHNILSHDKRFPFEETALRAGLATRADAIHIMNPATRELAAKYYELDSRKVFSAAHPSYLGVYPDFISGSDARLKMGLSPDARVVLLFGSLSPQKGTRQFLREIAQIRQDLGSKIEVLVAGAPGDPDYMEDIYWLAADDPFVHLLEGHVSEQMLQVLFKAADVAVCPYESGLNSGVAATAATFGCPCVVPDVMVPAMAGAGAGVTGFNARNRSSLSDAIKSALDAAKNPATKLALAAWSDRHRPSSTSKVFFSQLMAQIS